MIFYNYFPLIMYCAHFNNVQGAFLEKIFYTSNPDIMEMKLKNMSRKIDRYYSLIYALKS